MEEMRAARRKYWTPEEDDKLIEYVNTHGTGNWNKVAQSLDIGKSGSSCLQRYNNYLAPGLVHGDFTEEEIDKMKMLLDKHSKEWEVIARHLPGRRGNSVKNWYHKQEARELKRAMADGEGHSVGVPLGDLNVDDFGQSFLGDLNIVDDFESFNQQFVESADNGFAVVDDVIDDIHQYLNYSSTPDDLLIYNVDGLWDFNDHKFLNNGGGGADAGAAVVFGVGEGGDGFGGYNLQFVESADGGFSVVDQYLNYSSTPGPDDLQIYNVDDLWDFNDHKFHNGGASTSGGGGAGA